MHGKFYTLHESPKSKPMHPHERSCMLRLALEKQVNKLGKEEWHVSNNYNEIVET